MSEQPIAHPGEDILDFVNLRQGTESHFGFSTGNTLPLVAMPFGMTHWCPQTRESGKGWFFHPSDRKLEGIRATHQPSPWIGDYGHFVVMPQTGELHTSASDLSSAYRPDHSVFRPHYCRVYLERYDCMLELTPTARCAAFRFGFGLVSDADPAAARLTRRILVVPGEGGARIEIDAQTRTVRGWTHSNSDGVPEGFALYFVARFDQDFTGWGVYSGKWAEAGGTEEEGHSPGAYVEFGSEGSPFMVEARVGTSFISWDQAERNLEREAREQSFNALKDAGAKLWQAALGRLRVEGGTEEQRRTLYSCLYRTQLFPRDFHEYDGAGQPHHYSPYDGQVHPGRLVTDNGFWDTYRTVYPLYSLLCPERLGEILDGWLAAYRESGWLPTWASPGHRLCMVGTHADAVFADAVSKGIEGFDLHEAYRAVRQHAFEVVEDDTGFGRLGLKDYMELGFVPHDRFPHASASRTLDYAYDDFCVAQVAWAAGADAEAAHLELRAGNWRHVYDVALKMMRGRYADGSWREPWDPFEWGGPFVEGGPWQHTWGVPHDPAALIDAMWGPENFVAMLERMLALSPRFRVGSYGFEIHEMTEMASANFGQYAHSNQPVHHALYLFACAGRPDLTQYWVRRVVDDLYSSSRLPGDEDNGEMSAWYVFSAALGLYPLCPGHASYVLGSPSFPLVRLTLPEGRELVVRADCEADRSLNECPYVASVSWRGKPWSRLWISHAELMEGGELRFRMSAQPPARRVYSPEELPFSLSRAARHSSRYND